MVKLFIIQVTLQAKINFLHKCIIWYRIMNYISETKLLLYYSDIQMCLNKFVVIAICLYALKQITVYLCCTMDVIDFIFCLKQTGETRCWRRNYEVELKIKEAAAVWVVGKHPKSLKHYKIAMTCVWPRIIRPDLKGVTKVSGDEWWFQYYWDEITVGIHLTLSLMYIGWQM